VGVERKIENAQVQLTVKDHSILVLGLHVRM